MVMGPCCGGTVRGIGGYSKWDEKAYADVKQGSDLN